MDNIRLASADFGCGAVLLAVAKFSGKLGSRACNRDTEFQTGFNMPIHTT